MLTFSFAPFPLLKTKRLHLRRLEAADINEIILLRGDAENMKFIPRPLVKTKEQALEHFEMIDVKIRRNEGINWAITLEDSSKMIGIIGHYRIKAEHFRSEIGYMLLAEYHHKGIATEAIKAVVDYGFDVMQLHSIEAVINPNNYGSEKVLLKNGFIKEGHFIENEWYNGQFLDSAVYSLLKKNHIK